VYSINNILKGDERIDAHYFVTLEFVFRLINFNRGQRN